MAAAGKFVIDCRRRRFCAFLCQTNFEAVAVFFIFHAANFFHAGNFYFLDFVARKKNTLSRRAKNYIYLVFFKRIHQSLQYKSKIWHQFCTCFLFKSSKCTAKKKIRTKKNVLNVHPTKQNKKSIHMLCTVQ